MNWPLISILLALGAAYLVTCALAPAARRRREARALRRLMLGEIHHGARSFDDPEVREILAWCRQRAA